MRELQIIAIPAKEGCKSRNMSLTEAMEFFKISKEELEKYIESGDEINGWWVDEALYYDSKIS